MKRLTVHSFHSFFMKLLFRHQARRGMPWYGMKKFTRGKTFASARSKKKLKKQPTSFAQNNGKIC